MSGTDAATYSLRHAQQSLGLSRSVLCGLIGEGFVLPQRGERNALRFSFRDLMLLRTAYALQQARIPPRKILQSLAQLRARLSDDAPITALRITAVGRDVAVSDALGQWSVESGQALMNFDEAQGAPPPAQAASGAAATATSIDAVVKPVPAAAPCAAANDAADDVNALASAAPGVTDPRVWFQHALAAESADAAGAERAYRQAIRLDPAFVDAYVNLGAMLCEQRRCDEAVRLYDAAAVHCEASAQLWFNRAIALEDAGRAAEAASAYEQALRIDPATADAHFNLGRLRERAGDARGALRHFSAYRRLQK